MLTPHRRSLRALAPRARRRTRIPACASSAAATPPPAPEPTTTASQSMVTLSSSVCARACAVRVGRALATSALGPGRAGGAGGAAWQPGGVLPARRGCAYAL